MDSIGTHLPGAERFIVVAEAPGSEAATALPGRIARPVFLDQLPLDWRRLAFQYDAAELSTALKPSAFLHLFEAGYEAVLFFHAGGLLVGDARALAEWTANHDIVLLPHFTEPRDPGQEFPVEELVRIGAFNTALIGARGTPDSAAFFRYWKAEAERKCIFDAESKSAGDGAIASLAPGLLDACRVIRHPGYGIAKWNLCQRPLRIRQGRPVIGERDAVHVDFRGLANRVPLRLPLPLAPWDPATDSAVRALLDEYERKVTAAADEVKLPARPYTFGTYADGSPIPLADRRKYLFLPSVHKDEIGNPFEAKAAITGIQVIGPVAFADSEIERVLAGRLGRVVRALKQPARRAFHLMRWLKRHVRR
jgi:hypothetical protein